MRLCSLIMISYLFVILGCFGSSQSPGQPLVSADISEEHYQKLLSLDDKALIEKALSGDLGNCQLQVVSQSGCEQGEPVYGINLVNQGIYFPSMTGTPDQYCMNETGKNLHLALQEGYCFTEQVSYDDFSDDGLSRKAYLGQLGKCKVEKASEDGSELRKRMKSGECF